MTSVPAWFGRTFSFPYPFDLLPNLYSRLRGTPARLEDLLRSRSSQVLAARPDGKWSVQEHAGHLLDLEPLWLSRVHDFLAEKHELTVADLTNRKTDEANHNARPLTEILNAFRKERERLLDTVAKVDASRFLAAIPHPRLKTPMRLADHLFFVAEHDDHHLASIWQMISEPF